MNDIGWTLDSFDGEYNKECCREYGKIYYKEYRRERGIKYSENSR